MIIGFCGKAGAGKTTAVALLKEHIGPKAVELSFAAPLKAFVREVFDWTHEHTDGRLKEVEDTRYPRPKAAAEFGGPQHLSPRYALQMLGTEWGRRCYSEVWVRKCLRRAEALRSDGYTVLISDVRFPNEGDFIQWAGGFVVRVDRQKRSRASEYENHPSEALIDQINVDVRVDNDQGVDHLAAQIIAAYHGLAGAHQ
jgi:hypothetical protein